MLLLAAETPPGSFLGCCCCSGSLGAELGSEAFLIGSSARQQLNAMLACVKVFQVCDMSDGRPPPRLGFHGDDIGSTLTSDLPVGWSAALKHPPRYYHGSSHRGSCDHLCVATPPCVSVCVCVGVNVSPPPPAETAPRKFPPCSQILVAVAKKASGGAGPDSPPPPPFYHPRLMLKWRANGAWVSVPGDDILHLLWST